MVRQETEKPGNLISSQQSEHGYGDNPAGNLQLGMAAKQPEHNHSDRNIAAGSVFCCPEIPRSMKLFGKKDLKSNIF